MGKRRGKVDESREGIGAVLDWEKAGDRRGERKNWGRKEKRSPCGRADSLNLAWKGKSLFFPLGKAGGEMKTKGCTTRKKER